MIATKSTELPIQAQAQKLESAPTEPTAAKPQRRINEEFAALVKAANQGDEEARKRVRQLLDTRPDIWRSVGDLDSHARAALIRVLSPSWLASESIERVMAAMKEELAGPVPSALANMAAEQVVICWSFLRHAELNALEVAGSLGERRFRDKAVDQAHRRYLESIKVLGALIGLSALKTGAIVTHSQTTLRKPDQPTDPVTTEAKSGDGRIKSSNELKTEASKQGETNGHDTFRNAAIERAA